MSRMSIPAALDSDRAHLLHPLHHPSAYASARIRVSGDGALIGAVGNASLPTIAGVESDPSTDRVVGKRRKI